MKYLKLLLYHSEKVIFFALLLVFIILNLTLIFKIRVKLESIESYSRLRTVTIKNSEINNLFSDETFLQLEQTIKTPKELFEFHKRNIFNKKSEKTKIIETPVIDEKVTIEDSDQDGMPDKWENKFGLNPHDSTDSKSDKDKDGYSNLDEYIGGTDPTNPESFPGKLKLKVLDIYRKRVRIKFKGYSKEPDGDYKIQINWGNRSYFMNVDEKIRGYTIIDFTKDSTKQYNPVLGGDTIMDTSFIRIQKLDETPIKLTIGKSSYEKELFAKVKDENTKKTYHLHSGSRIKSYEVLDITESKVIIERNKISFILLFERKE